MGKNKGRKRHNPLKGLLFGLVAGAAASAAMDQYWGMVERVPGARPEQQPRRGGNQQKDEPSTQIIADRLSEALTGKEVPEDAKPAAGVVVHYLTGALQGGLFGLVAAVRPRTGLFAGLLYGVAIWLFLDELTLRLLNLAPDPDKVPKKQHVEALGAHLVYGGSLALLTRRFLR
ncbi:MAG: hypothetical protein QOH93_3011 [Chloroflexia bacterium]|jgi:uncharacterized membrane protein YagU involved in acid resistance|nr:hypothetical protein [Chloroflexia bacterium]